jgi:hypothetical protein
LKVSTSSDERQPAEARGRRVTVDLAELELAFEEPSLETAWYLDLETGRLARVDAETRRELESIYENLAEAEGAEQPDFAELLRARDLPDWQQEALVEADEVERGYGVRLIAVPRSDSRQDYADMEEFIAKVADERPRARLFRAIQGRGAFGRFHDTLDEAPAEAERWLAFKANQSRARVLAWLESVGIEPDFAPDPETHGPDRDPARISAAASPRPQLIAEALGFARAASRLPGVTRIALLGSLTTPKPAPKDADLLVTVADDADIAPLAALGRKLQGHAQSLGRGADVFLADPAGNYLGRTCPWKECRPGKRLSCDATNCGRRPYLHDDLAAVVLPWSLVAVPPVELWPTVVVRVPIPVDLEQALAELRWE